MKVFGFNISRSTKARKSLGTYQAGMMNRLTADWPIAILSADAALRWNLRQLRARSRDLERNGGINERYLSALETNVIGSQGVQLQMKARPVSASATQPEKFDRAANEIIEKEWDEFGLRGNFDITGKHSRQDFWRLALRTTARDGDALILVYRGGNVPNKWKIAFQLIEGDYLDDLYEVRRGNGTYGGVPAGHTVSMGVELDEYKRKVAYWVLASHPGETMDEGVNTYVERRRRIPALGTEPGASVHCLHLTLSKRAEQTRGVPWITPAMMAIKMLEGYEEAELVAARAQACKHVFFERQQFGPDGSPLDYGEEDAGTGQLVDDTEPGGSTELPIGYHANFYNPSHPNQAFPDFTKSIKRKISSALNCAYNTLFVDLESVNYSSIRAGLLDEREEWKMKQNWAKDDLVIPSFGAWLQMQLMVGTLAPNALGTTGSAYGLLDYPRLNAPEFKFRKWQWVDPRKDIETAQLMLESKLTTRTRLISDFSSDDFEETIDEIAAETQYIDDAGLDPFVHEPRRAAEFIDSAETANDPDANPNLEPLSPSEERRRRALAQARHPDTGQFIAADTATAPSGKASQTINFNVEPQKTGEAPTAPQTINVNVDASKPAKRSFKIKRQDGTVIEGEIESAEGDKTE